MFEAIASPKVLLWAIIPSLLAFAAIYIRPPADVKSAQCSALSALLPGKVLFPSSAPYAAFSTSYWSKQEESLSPGCVVRPTNAEDVSTSIRTLVQLNKAGSTKCSFAIRGGGHTPWAGSANIEGGVTIDLKNINDVAVNQNKTLALVGGGARWGEVYQKMDSLGLSVVGGRGSSIGVGGLLTGGGLSYFSARKGFACDNVVNYEIVLADGRIVEANAGSHSDLWLALKGGSNNFGVITRFDLKAFPQGNFWGGMILYAGSVIPQLLDAFTTLNHPSTFDEYAALIFSFSYTTNYGIVASANIEYTAPVVNPPTFHKFTSTEPQLMNTMRISNQTDFTVEFSNSQPDGRRQLYLTSTFSNSLPFLTSIYRLFQSLPFGSLSSIPNLALSVTIQPIPPATTSKSALLGGNSLGLSPADGSLVLCLLSATWDNPTDDAVITHAVNNLHENIIAEAKKLSLLNKWIYLNYANRSQDPLAGYGPSIQEKLRMVSDRYDREQVFQKLVPGGFKLP